MRRLVCLLFLLPLLARGGDFKKQLDAIASDRSSSDSERLHQIFAADWEQGMHHYPEFATSVGYPGLDGQWTDMSEAAIAARDAERPWVLDTIKTIDRAQLDAADQLNYDLFRRGLERSIEGHRFPGELLAISQMGGVHQSIAQTLEDMPRTSVQAYENILARMRGAPVVVEQNIALLQRGLDQGVTPPKITLRDVPKQVEAVIPDDPLQSPLLLPFRKFPKNISKDEQDRLRAEAVAIYEKQLAPAYRKLLEFLKDKYVPGARETIGFSALPNGADWYAYSVRETTTTGLSPKEIHELGLREVDRIQGEMDKVIAETKFKGNPEGFRKFLQTDPQFYYTNKEDLLAGYRDIAKRIDPELARLFGRLPRLPYGVKPVPAYAEQSAAAAYYEGGSEKAGRPGWFVANTYNLPGRPKWQMESLTLHEAVPGHHLQISLAQEMENVPEFRKYDGYTAYTEGWGLYAESLGDQLGLYQNPYSRYGALTFEMWRAVRLVLDTGMHALGWTREQAIDYMMQHAQKDKHEATVEVDRYIVWPAQALAYKIGQLKITALREKARQALGEAFDLRAFHDTVLANGSLPLDVLEARVDDWIARQKTQTKPQ